jgi:hypothetical protein
MSTIQTAHLRGHRASILRLSPLAFGGSLSALGALSVVITSLFYAISPRAAAGPVAPLDLAAAMSGAASGAASLHAAGTVGVFGGIIWAIAALIIAGELARRGRGVSAAGWIGLFLAILIFTLVDGMTGYVMPALAAASDSAGFEAFKRFWDMLFLAGTFAYGAGVVLAMAGEIGVSPPMLNRPLAWYALAVAAVGGLAATAGLVGFAGLPVDRLAGGSIGLGALLFVPISLQIAKAGDRP